MADLVSQLGELSELHVAGHLCDDEFALAKARLLRPEIAADSDVGPRAPPDAASPFATVAAAMGQALAEGLATLTSAIAEGLGASSVRCGKRPVSPVQPAGPASSTPPVQHAAKRPKTVAVKASKQNTLLR